jgi:uncharacterized protein YbaR (Trm112 family)
MIAPEILEILCCPETHQPLRFADASTVAGLNQKIASGTVRNRAGKPVLETIDGALIREDGQQLYLIRGDIPVMLIDEAIMIGQPGA